MSWFSEELQTPFLSPLLYVITGTLCVYTVQIVQCGLVSQLFHMLCNVSLGLPSPAGNIGISQLLSSTLNTYWLAARYIYGRK
jgi:hypothetical protein